MRNAQNIQLLHMTQTCYNKTLLWITQFGVRTCALYNSQWVAGSPKCPQIWCEVQFMTRDGHELTYRLQFVSKWAGLLVWELWFWRLQGSWTTNWLIWFGGHFTRFISAVPGPDMQAPSDPLKPCCRCHLTYAATIAQVIHRTFKCLLSLLTSQCLGSTSQVDSEGIKICSPEEGGESKRHGWTGLIY